MIRLLSVLPVSSLLLVVLLLPQAYSQDAAKEKTPKTDGKSTAAKADAVPAKKGRLPHNYGKLDLSEEQREKIYGIQAQHQEAIEKLEKQLESLKDKQAAEVYAVLTAPQQ